MVWELCIRCHITELVPGGWWLAAFAGGSFSFQPHIGLPRGCTYNTRRPLASGEVFLLSPCSPRWSVRYDLPSPIAVTCIIRFGVVGPSNKKARASF